MLNCTDLECILHHHHYYHHLHQLQHQEQHHHAGVGDPASENDDVLQLLNSTDGELSGLSHLDAPISDSVYIVCGVLIAMVLVGLIIVLLALTISHNGVPSAEAVVSPVVGILGVLPAAASAGPAIGVDASSASGPADEADGKPALELFLWSYPSQPGQPGQPSFSATKDALVRELARDVPQDSKGLRKNLRGRWKRLVKRKPEDSCGIPPELRDQLKQIYVY